MGGLGSGRRPAKLSVADCRSLAISEFTAAVRKHGQTSGAIIWRRDDLTTARLCYTISEEYWPQDYELRILALRYWPALAAPEARTRIVLAGEGKPDLAFCPDCGRSVRKLYAPPQAAHFLCWRCQDLVHRRPAKSDALAVMQAAMGSLLHGLYPEFEPAAWLTAPADKRAARAELLQTIEEEQPLRAQERRVYCLHLAKEGFSCRDIALLVDSSKSSVQRYLVAGRDAIDMEALDRERLARYYELHPLSFGQLRRYVRERYRAQAIAREREEKLFLPGEPCRQALGAADH